MAEPQKWAGDTAVASARLGGSPPDSTHVAALAVRLLLNVTDAGSEGIVQWSYAGEANHETWDALNYAEAEADPDTALAIASNANELFVWGSRTLQVFAPDPIVGFAPGRALPIGTAAAYSPALLDQNFVWLDGLRRFVLSDGRSYQVVSGDIARELAEMDTVSDGWGWRAFLGRTDVYGCVFPAEGTTMVWQADAQRWSQWRSQDATTGALTNWGARCLYQWPEKNLALLGLADGTIGKVDAEVYTDLGAEFPVEIRSGFVSRGTDAYKSCDAVQFTFKRGQVAPGTTPPVVLISWRDDLGGWTTPERFSLGNEGDNDPVLELRSLGTYRRRQWRIEFTGNAPFVFLGANEEFSPLGR